MYSYFLFLCALILHLYLFVYMYVYLYLYCSGEYMTDLSLRSWNRLVGGSGSPLARKRRGGDWGSGGLHVWSKLFVLADVHRPKYAWVCRPGSFQLLPNLPCVFSFSFFYDACRSSCYSGCFTASIHLSCHHLQPLWWKLFHSLIKGTPVKHYRRQRGQHSWRLCHHAAALCW